MNRFARKRWSSAKHAGHERGQSMTEFALMLPVALLILLGTVVLGAAFETYMALSLATGSAAQQLAIGVGQVTDPCATASKAAEAAAPQLKASNFTFTVALGPLGGTQTTQSGTSCTSLAASLTPGDNATVTATYPAPLCNVTIFGSKGFKFNLLPTCTFTSQSSEYIQ